MAINYNDGESRIIGSSALSAIDSFNRNRVRLELSGPIKGARLRFVSSHFISSKFELQDILVPIRWRMWCDEVNDKLNKSNSK
jgi:large subunit ribosomal protein L17e